MSVEGIENIDPTSFYSIQPEVDDWTQSIDSEPSQESSGQEREHQSSATPISSDQFGQSEIDDADDSPPSVDSVQVDENEADRICYGMVSGIAIYLAILSS